VTGGADQPDEDRPLRAVALGGGHGLQATLRALRRITPDVTAVVTVADDGGSSGRLRRELGLLPPGDLRKALAALADAQDGLWWTVFEHRFGGDGALAGHAVGNLVLAGLFEVLGDPVAALDNVCRLLGASGRVLPMSELPLDMEADVVGLDADPHAVRTIRGQVAIASTPGRVKTVRLYTANGDWGPPTACPEAVRAVLDADVIVLNLVAQPGETAGFSPEQHLDVLSQHAPRLRADAVLADAGSVPTPDRLRAAAAGLGAQTLLDKVAQRCAPGRHDPEALAESLLAALERRTDRWR
jgi:2-phospho-L-lactate transferase/gluconeogenesis factor (CofD/UPF0052 family)